MSSTFVVLTGRRSAYRWLQQHHMPFLHRNAIKELSALNAATYCISAKDKNEYLSKVNDFKFENLKNTNFRANTKLRNIRKHNVSKLEETDKFMSERLHDERINRNTLIHKKLEQLYPNPKSSLIDIYKIVSNELKDQTVLISNLKQFHSKSKLWEIIYDIKWPKTMSFKGVGKTKQIAFKSAALKCLQWLEMNGKLKNGKPIIYDKGQISDILLKPVELSVTAESLDDMKNLIETYDTKIRDITRQEDVSGISYNVQSEALFAHPILGEMFDSDIYTRSKILKDRLLERRADHVNLPIFEFKHEILSKLQDNRILLIEGDTGCGKTTQVPQFIIDSFARNGNATDCNILVSQPRRISAISLADRVAHERGESVGDVVGYQVRLEKVMPRGLGGILFCTTGILLKKLQFNPGLEGCSHVILDEAHERSIDTDMLMILLKRALEQNPDLKLLIMSATINTHLFQRYFDCPTVNIPGRLYPVQTNFLDDIVEHLPRTHKSSYRYARNNDEGEALLVDYEKMVQIVKWISRCQPHGAILCFLPGWNDITRMQAILEDAPLDTEKQLILPMHSKISHDAQREAFVRAPVGTRKIILATDIAETGITISDVCYVVDSAIRKESRWDSSKDLLCIQNQWISRANIQQRKGRAGRVRPGISYHLITKAEYARLEPHPVAQVLCNSLEKVVFDSKMYTNEKAKDFLAGLLEPPSSFAIQKAVSYLINLGALDSEENLTTLGKRMTFFTTHPKFSKAIVYSSVFKCIHPVVTVASIFSGEDNLFHNTLDNKLKVRESKKWCHSSSDHIALSRIYKQWVTHRLNDPHLVSKFCEQMKIRKNRIEILSQIRDTFIEQLIMGRLLSKDPVHPCNNFDIEANKYEQNDEVVRAVLHSAAQQLIEHKNVRLKNGILRTNANVLRARGRAKAMLSGESVNYKRKYWPSPYLTYFNSAHDSMSRNTVVRETSMITPLTVLLFNQGQTMCREQEDGKIEVEINVDKCILRFSCDRETADALLKFRDIMWSVVQYSLEKQEFVQHNNCASREVFQYKDKLLETLAEILRASSKCIEDADVDESMQ